MGQRKVALNGAKTKRRVGPSAVGRSAGISKQAASRKLLQGKTPEEIVIEAQSRRERLARIRGVNAPGGVNRPGADGPSLINDNAGVSGVNCSAGSYADAARAKLAAQASRELLKLERERGALVPESLVQTLVVAPLLWFMQERRFLPARLRDDLHKRPGSECEEILTRELGHHQEEFARRLRLAPSDADSLFADYWEFVQWRKARAADGARP
jgi:hypothetical protein